MAAAQRHQHNHRSGGIPPPPLPPTPRWRPLPAFPDLPQLYVSPVFGSPGQPTSAATSTSYSSAPPSSAAAASYAVHVTDLASVWTEALDKKGILKRSLTEDTSIDLIDAGPDQWGVFLSKLAAAFDPDSPDHGSTGLTLESSSSSSSSSSADPGGQGQGGGDLVLRITCALPEPLEPLKWPVLLRKCTPAAAAERLVVPLLQSQRELCRDVDDLVARLGEKDAVITRLVDKLEAMGAGLENVFHTLPAKRKTSRAAAEDKVKGLKVFRETEWRETGRETDTERGDGDGADNGSGEDVVVALVRDAFHRIEGGSGRLGHGLGLPDDLNDWWTRLGPQPVNAVKPEANKTSDAGQDREDKDAHSKTTGLNESFATADDDDDFQVQNTPPHLQPAQKKRGRGRTATNAISEDENDDISIPDSHPAPAAAKSAKTSHDRAAHSAGRSSRTIPIRDDDTASESDVPASKPSTAPPTRKPKLGTIGARKGKAAQPAKEKSPSPSSSQPSEDDRKPQPPRGGPGAAKNGNDGHNDDDTASGSDSDVAMHEPKSKAQSPSSPKPQQVKKGALGRIGAKGKAPAPRSRSASPAQQDGQGKSPDDDPPAASTRSHDDPATTVTMGDDSDGTASSRESSPVSTKTHKPKDAPEAKPPPPPPRRTLGTIGKIGGKKQASTTTTSAAAGGATSTNSVSTEQHDDLNKKRTRQDSTPAGTPATTTSGRGGGGGAGKAAQPPREDEDDEQRAERKRAELAKELERKAAAPVKKKRRF
ncbi:XRCC4-like factor-domain-containing protein [Microdochium trichocladiopsis]|uniref:Non-homologous end-joining factor 1 n=1 Tax=Microdochium trichocladiopsis TaxID=1682393 RepID=A0A9P9BSQ6_9PEZI|nr:XRCC4-like factor-domain-containing protein [Microdochium trichocladiopsis]KAH7034697.1 XRCC4-like factor-domain-containing protein [Microdochium trichocladiopsis]